MTPARWEAPKTPPYGLLVPHKMAPSLVPRISTVCVYVSLTSWLTVPPHALRVALVAPTAEPRQGASDNASHCCVSLPKEHKVTRTLVVPVIACLQPRELRGTCPPASLPGSQRPALSHHHPRVTSSLSALVSPETPVPSGQKSPDSRKRIAGFASVVVVLRPPRSPQSGFSTMLNALLENVHALCHHALVLIALVV